MPSKIRSALCLSCLLLLGCSALNQLNRPIQNKAKILEMDTQQGGKGVFVLRLPALGPQLSTQVAKTVSDFQSFKLYLVLNASGVLTTAAGPFTVNKLGINASGDSQTVIFRQVQAGSFYVAAAGYDGQNGSGANITNLASGATIGGEYYYVSNGGGESPTYPGRVSVNSSFDVTGTDPLTLTLSLLDD